MLLLGGADLSNYQLRLIYWGEPDETGDSTLNLSVAIHKYYLTIAQLALSSSLEGASRCPCPNPARMTNPRIYKIAPAARSRRGPGPRSTPASWRTGVAPCRRFPST